MKPVICLSALLVARLLLPMLSLLGAGSNASRPASSNSSPANATRCRSPFPGKHGHHPRAAAFFPAHGRYQPADIGRRCVAPAGAQCVCDRLSERRANGISAFARPLSSSGERAADAGRVDGTIHVTNCAEAEPLLSILGYHARPACGQKDSTLMTADPERAFLTTDSGFPLTALEEALEKGRHSPTPSPIPAFRCSSAKTIGSRSAPAKSRGAQSLVDILLHEPAVDRLYWALVEYRCRNQDCLATLARLGQTFALRPGSRFLWNPDLHSRRPGGRSRRALRRSGLERAGGRQPKVAGRLCPGLVGTDNGWLAVYFDTLSRVNASQQAYLTASAPQTSLRGISRAGTQGLSGQGRVSQGPCPIDAVYPAAKGAGW